MASPNCTVQIGSGAPVAAGNGVVVPPGVAITVALADYTGYPAWSSRIENSSGPPPTLQSLNAASNPYSVQFVAPAAGSWLIFTSINLSTSIATTLSFAVYVANPGDPVPTFGPTIAASIASMQRSAQAYTQEGLITGVTVGGDLGGSIPNPFVSQLTGIRGIVTLLSGDTISLTQGGTSSAPNVEHPLIVQPIAKNDGRTKASYRLRLSSNQFAPNPTWDEVLDLGYNVAGDQMALPTARYSIESDYEVVGFPGVHQMEMHGQYSTLGAGTGTTYRWLSSVFRAYSTLMGSAYLNWKDGSAGDVGSVTFGESTAAYTMSLATAGVTIQTNGFFSTTALGAWTFSGGTQTSNIAANSMVLLPQRPFAGATFGNRQGGLFVIDLPAPITGGTESYVYIKRNSVDIAMSFSGDGNFILGNPLLAAANYFNVYCDGSTHINASKGTFYVQNLVANGNIQVGPGANGFLYLITGAGNPYFNANNNGIQLFDATASSDFGGGVGVVGLTKATTNPTTNPAGAVLYAEHTSGAFKARDALGADCNLTGGYFTVAMADAAQVVTAANSASKYYRTTGAMTAARALTITLPPNIGTMVVVRNDTTGGFAVNVQFATGASVAVAAGTSALVCGDGVNAFGMLKGT